MYFSYSTSTHTNENRCLMQVKQVILPQNQPSANELTNISFPRIKKAEKNEIL